MDMRVDPKSGHFIQGLAKGLAVIQAFNQTDRAMTLSDVADRTGLSRAAARRILMTLEALGFAARRDERHFVLTPRVLSLGYAYLSSMPLWSFAEPTLESLVEEIGETCALAVLDGTAVVYVLRIPVHRILAHGVTVGSRLPAYCNSHGRVLLAGLNPAQLRSYFEHARFTAFTGRTLTDPAKLATAIEQVRKKGYAWVSGEMQESISGLSVPVHDVDGHVIAALNVSVNRPSVSETTFTRNVLPKLRRAAERLNSSLAFGMGGTRVVRRR